MSSDSKRLSRSVEDYLKAVFALTRDGGPASTSALAEQLAVQPASVTGMVKRLAGAGLLAHAPYRGVLLTENGRREALRVIRRHRVLETYLTERLGYAWEDVHQEAERLEHTASDRLIDAMAHALGDPSHDPHGSPIPTARGEIESASRTTLAAAVLEEPHVIESVRDDRADDLRAMEADGLVPGAAVTVLDRVPGRGLRVRVGGGGADGGAGAEVEGGGGSESDTTTMVPPAMADRIFVTPR
ncbi:MAG: metal-dependent transcriptional regulator [Longimicrobiales bacterium]|nr:metal-dependent transcriptional regulator [Longimicrobiales bacterium]